MTWTQSYIMASNFYIRSPPLQSDIGARFRNQCSRGKSVSITYYERVSVAIVIQQGTRIRHITCILSSVICPALQYTSTLSNKRRSQWPRGLRRRSTAACLLRSWVRIPLGAWMFVCCECCVLSGRGLFDGLITRSEESYWLWCVVVCDQETS